MKKHFIVPQPPLTEKYRLLVDDMSEKRNFGFTTDIDKILYNKNILGDDFNMDLTIKNIFTDDGITSVFPIGCFITVLQLKKDEAEGKMTFFDFEVDIDKAELKNILKQQFSDNIVNAWLDVYDFLRDDFCDEDDRFELFRPDLDQSDLS